MSLRFISLLDDIKQDLNDNEYLQLCNLGLETHKIKTQYENTFVALYTSFEGKTDDFSNIVRNSSELNSLMHLLLNSMDNTYIMLQNVLQIKENPNKYHAILQYYSK